MMSAQYSKPLVPGDAIDCWTLSAITEEDFPGAPAPAFDGQGYRFINGFVAIGDLPCRKALRATVLGRDVRPERDWPVETLRLPAISGRIDFAGFWHRPTRLGRWARTTLVAAAAGSARFRLATCGGVRVWCGDRLLTTFEPYIRNIASETEITLPLAAGRNDILVLTEDMAERDTNWFFELTLLYGGPLSVELSYAADADLVADVARLATGVRAERNLFVDSPLAIAFDAPAARDVTLRARIVSVHHDHTTRLDREVTLSAGATRLDIAPPGAVADGLFNLNLSFQVGDAVVERTVEAAFLADVTPPPAPATIAERKAEAARWFAANGQPRMGRVLAMMAADAIEPKALREILEITLDIIERRHDCSDFEMVPLLWLWRLWRDRLPEDLKARTRRAILDYRYWVDEPGNDVMWYWSENHVLCFHVAQYLAGRLFPSEVFTCSGRSGAEQETRGRQRLGLWFDAIDAEGLAEWNSAAYYPVDFIGLLGLDQDADATLKPRVRKLMDRLFGMIALHTMAGVPGGSQGRAYTKELLAGPLTNLAPVARIAFGTGWLNEGVAAAALFAVSDYEPPRSALDFAEPAEGEAIEVRYTQGVDHAGRLVVYRGRNAQLSTVVDHLTGKGGHQQHVVDVLLSGHTARSRLRQPPGRGRPVRLAPAVILGRQRHPAARGAMARYRASGVRRPRLRSRLDARLSRRRPRRGARRRRLDRGALRQGLRRAARRQRPDRADQRPDRRPRGSFARRRQRLDCHHRRRRHGRLRALRHPPDRHHDQLRRHWPAPDRDSSRRRRARPVMGGWPGGGRSAGAVQPFQPGAGADLARPPVAVAGGVRAARRRRRGGRGGSRVRAAPPPVADRASADAAR